MTPPIFVSGPHGCGKTTLLEKLFARYDLFLENDFDIDFVTDFPHITVLTDFEKCLLRLYHRNYLTDYARLLARRHNQRVILTSRGVYDSEAYTRTYRDVGWINAEEYATLDFVLGNLGYRPYTIVVNPPVDVVWERLSRRRAAGVRKARDAAFKSEDTIAFLAIMSAHYKSMNNRPHVLYLEDNSDTDIEHIMVWLMTLGK